MYSLPVTTVIGFFMSKVAEFRAVGFPSLSFNCCGSRFTIFSLSCSVGMLTDIFVLIKGLIPSFSNASTTFFVASVGFPKLIPVVIAESTVAASSSSDFIAISSEGFDFTFFLKFSLPPLSFISLSILTDTSSLLCSSGVFPLLFSLDILVIGSAIAPITPRFSSKSNILVGEKVVNALLTLSKSFTKLSVSKSLDICFSAFIRALPKNPLVSALSDITFS